VRVLVATDAIGALSSLRAGQIIASGWARESVLVVPVGEAGGGFVSAFGDQLGVRLELWAAGTATVTWAEHGGVAVLGGTDQALVSDVENRSSVVLGQALSRLLAELRPRKVYLDLGGWAVADAGAGLLAALGAVADRPLDQGGAGLVGITQVDLGSAQAALGQAELIGVVPTAEKGRHLYGLRGITSMRRDAASTDPESILRQDTALQRFAALTAAEQGTKPGAGACGGLGFAVLALGGRLATGPAIGLGLAEAEAAISEAPGFLARGLDLVVTGCSIFDFATRGGGVLTTVAERASGSLSPCIAIAGEVIIGSREMRAMGIEAAYAVRETTRDQPDSGPVSEDELGDLARRVARSWTW